MYADDSGFDDAAGYQDPGYRVVSVNLPSDLLEVVLRRVGPNGLSAYVTQALWRQEPRASLIDFHRWTAALSRAALDQDVSRAAEPPALH
ncbi:hypothetical protein MXD62_05140 [Frankia sp. Mgl5]|uniref:Uncharacterized protein n=1 Tax=Parafrankia soli TaxID=2599596 RepID=A0A1S1RIL0_9ACTN|nr:MULTISPECIES: hypothetical protein [Frankiaceae]MCK9926559.1 hypothetical protein [Frankia sp. Mgl5]TCJ33417.1 hypothetical protein E0504_37925 [Parafrankia sp. BMG5.11]CAI7974259.1 conserved hypothetical protein [Frankia sp. Hr75.2]SQD96506.1 conserved hypothetical protein [Parafrankia sp. Ea1.12]